MLKEKKFWEWFKNHQHEFLHLDDLDEQQKEALLNQLLNQLHEYCSGLYYQIGGKPSKERREFVITAEGNTDYFDDVEKLLSFAPEIDSWQLIAFKQPMGTDFITEYEGLILNPKKMWFLPLNNEKKPQMIGVRVCVDNYIPDILDKIKNAVYQVLDGILGEKATATEIDYLDVDDLSNYDIDKDGLIELVELRDYINWKIKKAAQ